MIRAGVELRHVYRLMDWFKILVGYIPGWVPANLITALRALMLIPIYFVYRGGHPLGVFFLFLLAWFTDIVDGLHARTRGQISSFGKLLDPAADKILVIGLIWMLAPGRLSAAVILTTVVLEAIIVLLTIVCGPLAVRWWQRQMKLGANTWGKVKMFLQGSGLVALILGINIRPLQVFSEVLFWAGAVFALVSIVFYIKSVEKVDLEKGKI
jgi:CDP-diacylglycerol---glycerol-3-phosphate 3-phosphatidyltransferase